MLQPPGAPGGRIVHYTIQILSIQKTGHSVADGVVLVYVYVDVKWFGLKFTLSDHCVVMFMDFIFTCSCSC